MTRRQFLVVVLAFLLIVLIALIAAFIAFQKYTAGPAAANTPGFVHVRTLYGWGDDPSELFSTPFGLTFRGGSLYVVDKARSQVAQITPTGSLVRLYGSSGAEGENLRGPTGVEVDSSGNVYVSDGGSKKRIVVYGRDGKYIRSVELKSQPLAFAIAENRMFVTTSESVKVFAMPALTELASWGTKGKGEEQFYNPNGVAFDPDTSTLYVSDGNNLRVKALNQQGETLWIFGKPPANMNDASTSRRFGLAGGMAFTQGHLFVADPLDATIHVLNTEGEEVAQLGDMGTANGQFLNPTMVAAMNGNQIAIAEWGNGRVQIFETDIEQASAAWDDKGGQAPIKAVNEGE